MPRSCRFLVIVPLLFALPALAAGVDCHQTADPITGVLCTHPSLLKMDAQLSNAYAAALARDPSHAADIKRDEIAWLSERDRQISWSLPNDIVSTIARVYEQRIAFLNSVGNLSATSGLPIARAILAVVATWPTNADDPLKALQSAGIVVLAKDSNVKSSVDSTIAALAAPPTAALRTALAKFQTPGSSPFGDVYYLPSARLGGTYNVEGTADCQSWVLFEKRGEATIPVSAPSGVLTGGCMRDGGSTGYLALIDGDPVALNLTNDPGFLSTVDLQWRRWLGGNKWGPTVDVRFRYAVTYKLDGNVGLCPNTECIVSGFGAKSRSVPRQQQRQQIAKIAWNAAQRYIRNPLALSRVNAEDKANFQALLDHAPHLTTWANCATPTWFPAHLNGRLVVGGISELHFACHPAGPGLTIGIWGRRGDGKDWWFAADTVAAKRSGLLSVAVVPPPKRPL